MLRLAVVLWGATAGTVTSPAGMDQVRQAETAFAKAFADRDQAKFFAFVAEDATFLGPNETLSGKEKMREVWSGFFRDPKAPFSWRPERVVLNGAGDIGLSTGPVFDPSGKQVGNYSSIWRKQKDNTWKVIFDGPGAPVCPPTPSSAPAPSLTP